MNARPRSTATIANTLPAISIWFMPRLRFGSTQASSDADAAKTTVAPSAYVRRREPAVRRVREAGREDRRVAAPGPEAVAAVEVEEPVAVRERVREEAVLEGRAEDVGLRAAGELDLVGPEGGERRVAVAAVREVRVRRDAVPVWKSNLQSEFNVRVCDSFDASSLAVLRELDESNRLVQKSAESTSI